MKSRLREIGEIFSCAERIIKVVEVIGEGLVTTAVNQLRYVAFHIIRASQETDDGKKEEEYKKAKYHCQRAIHDATEIGLIHYLEKIEEFEHDYRSCLIGEVVSEHQNFCKDVRDAKKFLEGKIGKSINNCYENELVQLEKLDNDVEESSKHFGKLKKGFDKLEIARPELNKKIKKERDTLKRWLVGIVVLLLGILIKLLVGP